MKALTYYGAGLKGWDEAPDPRIIEAHDVFSRASRTGALKVVLRK